MASFCSFRAWFLLFHAIPWELFCTPGNYEFRIVGVTKTKHKRTTEGNDSHGYHHYSCPVDIRHFPVHEVLDGRHGKPCPIAYCGKLGGGKISTPSQAKILSPSPNPLRHLCLPFFCFRSSFRNPVIPTPLWRGKALRFAERVFVARFGSRIGDVDRVGSLGNQEAACFGCVELA